MSSSLGLRVGLAGGLAVLTLLLAGLHLAALVGGGEVSLGDWRLAATAAGYDRKAEALLSDDKPSMLNLQSSERLTRLALVEFPYDTSSWLRIAYIDDKRHGGLGPVGIAALVRSYDLVAADPELGPWRVHFGLENWINLPKSLKDSVREEANTLSTEGRSRGKLDLALQAVRNPLTDVMVTQWRQRYVVNKRQAEHKTPEKAAS